MPVATKMKTKAKKKEKDNYRVILEDFEEYVESKNKGLIKKYKIKELKKILSEFNMSHNQLDWYKAIEKRVKELKKSK